MKLLLEIDDTKAKHFVELLNDLSYVKTQTFTKENERLISEIKEAVDNLKKVKAGKLKARPVRELLDEL